MCSIMYNTNFKFVHMKQRVEYRYAIFLYITNSSSKKYQTTFFKLAVLFVKKINKYLRY